MDHNIIIDYIRKLSTANYLKINIRDSIKILLNNILPTCSQKNKQQIEQFINIIDCKITSKTMIDLKPLKNTIVNIINNAVNNKQLIINDGTNNDGNNSSIIDNNQIINNKTNEIEELLDSNITKYNKYNNDHPMTGVYLSKTSGKYRIVVGDLKTNMKKLDDACTKIIQNSGYKTTVFTEDFCHKIWFQYKNRYLVVYKINSHMFFDILHIIDLLDLKQTVSCDKYNIFGKNIEHRMWQKNKFNGYILRELIPESIMYALVMSSSSEFSKNFKKDVSNILVNLRSNNLLTIENDTLKLNNDINGNTIHVFKNESNMNNEHNLMFKQAASHKLYCYDSIQDIKYANSLVSNGSNIILTKYINKNVIYLVLLPIKTNDNQIIIKFGFTDNIVNRLKSLKDEYKCDVLLLDIRFVNMKSEEENFHILLHRKYPDCVFNCTINNKQKNELYYLSHNVVAEFSNLNISLNELNDHSVRVDPTSELLIVLKEQSNIFSKFIEDSLCLDNKTKYDYLMVVENNNHAKYIADLQFKTNQLEYNSIDKKIALLDKQIELAKLQKTC